MASVASPCLERVEAYGDDEKRQMGVLAQQICFEKYCGVTWPGDYLRVEVNDKLLLSGKEDIAGGEESFSGDLCSLLDRLLGGLREHGCELWARPRYSPEQTLVKDINPGPGDGIAPCPQPVVVGDVMYFIGDDGVHGQELWRSDGTSEGTWMVKDVNPGRGSGTPGVCRTNAGGDPSWVALGNVLIFVGFTPEQGYELWRSDGTEQGTWLLRDIWPGPRDGIECGDEDPVVPGFVVFRDKVLFKGNDGVTGLEPWVTDGTPEGTRLLTQLRRFCDESG